MDRIDIGYCVTMFCLRVFGKSKVSFISVSRVSNPETVDSEEFFILSSFIEKEGASFAWAVFRGR